ncbi:phage tail tape measure protein [Bacillus cytotoxicus]
MDKSIKGITIKLGADTTKLSSALNDVTKTSVSLAQELKKVERGLKLNPGNAELIAQKQKILSEQIANTSEKLNRLKAAQAQVNQKFAEGKISPEQYRAFNREIVLTQGQLDGLKGKLNSVSAEQKKVADATKQLQTFFRATGTSVDQFSNVLGSKLTNAIKNGTASSKQLDEAIDKIGKHSLGAGADIDKMRRALSSINDGNSLNNIQKELQSISREANKTKTSIKEMGEKLSGVGTTMSTRVTAPIVAAGTAATAVFSNFDDGMRKVQATMGNKLGKTTKEVEQNMKALTDEAKRLGSTTAFSASDAAAGMEKLALAGWDTNQIMAATEPMLNLASAAAMDLGTAADIVSDTMSAYGMNANEAQKATDIFAKTMSSTNTDVVMLGEAMKYVGANAKASNMDLVQTNAILGTLANAGIKGSSAGTALSAMLRDVKKNAKDGAIAIGETKVAVYDANGNMRDMTSILVDVEKATKKMNGAQRDAALSAVFGEEAIRGVNTVLQAGTKSVKDLEKELRNSEGTSKSMKETMEGGLGGAFRSLKSAVEGLAIAFGDALAPVIKSMAEKLTGLTQWFTSLDDSTKKYIVTAAAIAAAIGPVLIILGSLASSIGKIISLFGMFGTATAAVGTVSGTAAVSVGGLGTAFGGALLAIAPWLVAAGAVAAAGYGIYKALNEEAVPAVDLFKERVNLAADGTVQSVDKISESTQKAVGAFMDMSQKTGTELTNMYATQTAINEENMPVIVGKFDEMKNQIIAGYEQQKNDSIAKTTEMFATMGQITDEEKSSILEKMNGFYDQQKQKAQDTQNQIVQILNTAKEQKRALTTDEYNQLMQLQSNYQSEAVKSLSANKTEQEVILQNLKDSKSRMNAEMASDAIQKMEKQRSETVKKAQSEYDDKVRIISKMRDEMKVISADQADKLISDAKRQRDEVVSKANEIKSQGVDRLKSSYKGLEDQVDTSTGNILTYWDKLKRWWDGWNPTAKKLSVGVVNGAATAATGGRVQFSPRSLTTGVDAPKNSSVPMLATGGHVLGDGQFIAGEKGPELFTKQGNKVSVTPLSSREKSLGITGAMNQLYSDMSRVMASSMKQFAGLKNLMSNVYGSMASSRQAMTSSISNQVFNYSAGSSGGGVIPMLGGDLVVEVPVILEGKDVARGTYRYTTEYQEREAKRNSAF